MRISAKWVNVFGLVLGGVGVIGLFRYGLPPFLPTDGAVLLTGAEVDEAARATEYRYIAISWASLSCIISGIGLQISAEFIPERADLKGLPPNTV
nr:hypothetical protein [uncultured Rhodopila sp.]